MLRLTKLTIEVGENASSRGLRARISLGSALLAWRDYDCSPAITTWLYKGEISFHEKTVYTV